MKREIPVAVTLVGLTVSILGLFLVLNLTDPFESGSIGILIVLGLVYVLTLSALLILIRLAKFIYHLMQPAKKKLTSENAAALMNRRINLITAVISLMPVFIMSMNSIGQLNMVDIALIIVIEAILIFYIIRRTAK